jgi:ATP-binding cassette subfamily B protein
MKDKSTQNKKTGAFKELRYIRPSLKKVYKFLYIILFLTLVSAGLGLLTPYLSKLIFDKGILSNDSGQIIYYGLLTLVAYLISNASQFGAQAFFIIASNRFALHLKEQVLGHLFNLSFDFFDKKQSGYLVMRVNEADTIGGLFSPVLFQIFASLIQAIGALVIVVKINVPILSVMLPFALVLFFVARYMSRGLQKSSYKVAESMATSMGSMQEAVSGVAEIKQFTAESQKVNEIMKQFIIVTKNRIKQLISMTSGTTSIGFINSASGIVVIIIAGILITRGQLSIGDYVALSMYASQISAPFVLVGTLSIQFQPMLVALKRLALIFESKTEQAIWGNYDVKKIEGNIQFKEVSFRYDTDKPEVLKNCAFSINAGECIALYGSNGSGKSTILKLMLGFYPDYSGSISIDSKELHQYDLSSLRKRMGIVSQNIFLFDGTLESNVLIASTNASKEALKNALDLSGCSSLFKDKTDIIKTGEAGRYLSGGQKQAVAVARCILKDPDLLMFDEATAHLDLPTREIVLSAIKNVFKNRTRIIITQDREIAEIADRVFYLENGQVAEVVKIIPIIRNNSASSFLSEAIFHFFD